MLSDCKISFQPSILIFRKCFPLIFTSIHIWIIIIETASCIQKSKLQKQKGNKRCLSLLLVVSEWWPWGSRWSIQTPARHHTITMMRFLRENMCDIQNGKFPLLLSGYERYFILSCYIPCLIF